MGIALPTPAATSPATPAHRRATVLGPVIGITVAVVLAFVVSTAGYIIFADQRAAQLPGPVADSSAPPVWLVLVELLRSAVVASAVAVAATRFRVTTVGQAVLLGLGAFVAFPAVLLAPSSGTARRPCWPPSTAGLGHQTGHGVGRHRRGPAAGRAVAGVSPVTGKRVAVRDIAGFAVGQRAGNPSSHPERKAVGTLPLQVNSTPIRPSRSTGRQSSQPRTAMEPNWPVPSAANSTKPGSSRSIVSRSHPFICTIYDRLVEPTLS